MLCSLGIRNRAVGNFQTSRQMLCTLRVLASREEEKKKFVSLLRMRMSEGRMVTLKLELSRACVVGSVGIDVLGGVPRDTATR